jgi:hypothetical protein
VTVTLGGSALSKPRTTTLGPGEIGYLTYALSNKGHRLLRAQVGNQLGARLTVTTTAAAGASSTTGTTTPTTSPTATGGASIASASKTTLALISLVAFR